MALPTSTRLTLYLLPTAHLLTIEPSGSDQLVHLSIAAPTLSSNPPVPYTPACVCRGAPLASLGKLVRSLVPRVARVAVDVLCPQPSVEVLVRSCPQGTHALDETQVLSGTPYAGASPCCLHRLNHIG